MDSQHHLDEGRLLHGMALRQRSPIADPPARGQVGSGTLRIPLWILWLIVTVTVILIVMRLMAPVLIHHELIKRIDDSAGYRGSIGSVHLQIWRGAYEIRNIEIARTDDPQLPTLLSCARIQFSVAWRPLLHGRLVADATITGPVVHYAIRGAQRQMPTTTSPLGGTRGAVVPWQQHLQRLFPIRIDEVRIQDGKIAYRDGNRDLDLTVGAVHGSIANLTNDARMSNTGSRIATVTCDGGLLGGGSLSLSGTFDPLAAALTMHIRVAIQHVNLVPYNPALYKYEGVALKHGTLDFFMEADVDHGRLSGYAKPLLTDCSIYSAKDLQEHGLKVWKEALVGAANRLLKNHEKDSLATDVALTGTIDDPSVGVVRTIIGILRNGFIRALLPQFDRWRQHQ